MPIQSGDVKLLKSAVMSDVPEGGGSPTGNVIADGVSNAIFPDISELDRAGGRVNLRKTFATIHTDDRDLYFGANVIVAEPPQDPRVSVTLFSTKSTFDTRTSATDKIESYLIRGPLWGGFLFENHVAGQRVIQIFQRPTVAEVTIGRTIALVLNEGLVSEYVQYVRVIRTESVLNEYTGSDGKTFFAKVVTCDISDALRIAFAGSPPSETFRAATNKTLVRDTSVADAGSYFGVTALRLPAVVGATSLYANSVYTQLVPSAATEKIALDVTPSQDRSVVLATTPRSVSVGMAPHSMRVKIGQENRGFNYVQILNPIPAPGSLEVSFAALEKWYTMTDDGTGVLTGDGIGTVNYITGSVSVTLPALPDASSSLIYLWGSKLAYESHAGLVTYRPPEFSFDLEQRGITPGSLTVTWLSGGVLKTATADAAGVLSGHATGRVSYTRGMITIIPTAMLDSGGEFNIDYTWSPVVVETKTGLSASGGGMVTFTLNDEPVAGSIMVDWFTTRSISATSGSTLAASSSVKSSSASSGTTAAQTLDSKTIHTPAYDRLATWTSYSGSGSGGGGYGFVSGANSEPVTYTHVPARNDTYTTPRVTQSTTTNDTASGSTSKLSQTSNQVSNTVIEVFNSITENGTGGFLNGMGLINYVGKSVTLQVVNPSITTTSYKNDTESASDFVNATNSSSADPGQSGTSWNTNYVPAASASLNGSSGGSGSQQGGSYGQTVVQEVFDNTALMVTYRTGTAVNTPHTESYAPAVVQIDLAPYTTNRIVPNSIQFTWMGTAYRDFNGKLYRGYTDSTIGTEAGVIDYVTGICHITNYTVSGSPTSFTLNSLWTSKGGATTSKITCRTPSAPVKPGGFVMTVTSISGEQVIATANLNGKVVGSHVLGTFDYQTGVADIIFGDLVTDDTLTAEQKAEWWYAEALTQITAEGKVWRPWPVDPNTFRFNVVSYFYLPLDADILGVDPVRLPQDGRVTIFRAGGFAVVGNTGQITATVANAQVINCARVRLSRVRVIGNNGDVINTGYTTDLEAGTVTFTDVTGYSQPVTIEHRIEDMVQVSDVQINGQIGFTRPVTHDYPADTSYISSALVAGDLFSRVSTVFDQVSWTSVWQDSVIGTAATGTFNNVQYPITVTNRGALTERWAIQFTNTINFSVIGENVGVIATGNTSTDCAPLNPSTGVPYFTIPALGWGAGWSTGNVLRINTIGSQFPVWVVRTVQQGPETVTNDSFTLLLRGDVNA